MLDVSVDDRGRLTLPKEVREEARQAALDETRQ